jgi:hypothetical protein
VRNSISDEANRVHLHKASKALAVKAWFDHSVALMQLRFTSFAAVSSRRDFHQQDCAHAGRTTKKYPEISRGVLASAAESRD